MRDYSKAQIYKIVSNQTDLTYIGSTCQQLSKRMYQHRAKYRLYGDKYDNTAKRILCYDDAHIILIENHPCGSKWEMERRERHFIENTVCVNVRRPASTPAEVRETRRAYREKNPSKKYRDRQDKDFIRRYDRHRKSAFGGMCRLHERM